MRKDNGAHVGTHVDVTSTCLCECVYVLSRLLLYFDTRTHIHKSSCEPRRSRVHTSSPLHLKQTRQLICSLATRPVQSFTHTKCVNQSTTDALSLHAHRPRLSQQRQGSPDDYYKDDSFLLDRWPSDISRAPVFSLALAQASKNSLASQTTP